MFGELRRMNMRQIALQILNILTIGATALMVWKGLGLVTNTESPIVVVLSGSMEPAFHRGDLLFLTETGKEYLLTKGDNNARDDRVLYDRGQMWINKEHLVGKVKGFLPYVGMVTIMMNDYAWMKYAVLGVLGFFVLIHRE
ncbi:Putative Signal peptidase I [Rhizopus microsporus]|nr:Putative Signal peptidase I [Rhizopus microsporus]